ncbi:MAG TPA: hypothetical protein VMB49_07720 [Acidobacteriaceae bacterium]|nr:hypothetical protein [Acidobacteriaceae bacterium]
MMTRRNLFLKSVVSATLLCGGVLFAQAPVVNIDAQRHPNLAAAQKHIVQAYQMIDAAQSANRDALGGHGEKAKALLSQADAELRAAADVSNRNHH